MDIQLTHSNGTVIAEINSATVEIATLDDALDLIGNCGYQGATAILLYEKNINPDFFDLKTQFAGEILQKFSTYAMKLAIIGDFTNRESKSLRDFIYESNKAGRICFVSSPEEAREKLSGKK